MPAPQTVLTLIENFERNLDAYRSGKYNETQVRRDFIDPLFKALGWDMDNSAGYAKAYLFKNYPCANNRINLFAAFIERTLGVCKQNRFAHSMIVPTTLLTQDSYRALRKMVVDHYQISNVVRLPNESFGAALYGLTEEEIALVEKT